MKICLYNVTTTIKNGGIETVIRALGQCFKEMGHDVLLLGGHDPSFDYPLKDITQTASFSHRSNFEYFGKRGGKMYERLTFARHALPILKDFAPDVVQIFKPYDFIAAKWIKRKLNCKVIFASGGRDFFTGDNFFKSSIDRWAACSDYNADEIEAQYNIRPDVIFNPVDYKRFSAIDPRQGHDVRASFNIPSSVPVLLCVGRLVGWKGHRYLIDAMPKINDQSHLIIVGSGPEKEALLQQAQALGITSRVHLTGDIPYTDVPNYFAAATLYTQPSIADETFGITIAEAMSANLPVVGAAAGGIPQVVDKAGIIVPVKDADALAVAFTQLIDNTAQAQDLAAQGKKRAAENFDWHVIAKHYITLYESMLR